MCKKELTKFAKIKLIIAIVLLVLIVFVAVLFFACGFGFKPTKMITMTRHLKDVEYEGKSVFIHFYADDMEYRYNERNGISVYCFEEIAIGDEIEITVSEDYLNYKKVLIYRLSANGIVVYDHTELDANETRAYNIIMPTTIIITLVFLVLMVLLMKEKPKNEKDKFIISTPRWFMLLPSSLAVAGITTILMFVLMYLVKLLDDEAVVYSVIFVPFALMGVVFTIITALNKFTLVDGVYTYAGIFGRKRIAKVEDIGHIEVKVLETNKYQFAFFNKEGKKIIRYQDAFAANNILVYESIKHLNIKTKITFAYQPMVKK